MSYERLKKKKKELAGEEEGTSFAFFILSP
jgi:hypothetical protein